MYLLRCLVFITKHFGIQLEISLYITQGRTMYRRMHCHRINVIALTGFHLSAFSNSRHSTQTVEAAGN